MSDHIEIKFTAQEITPEKFLAAVQNFVEIVQGVGRNIAGTTDPIRWAIEADRGSAIIRVRAKNRIKEAREAIEAVRCGFHSLRTGSRVTPRGFTVTELNKTQELADLVSDEFPITVKNGDSPEEMSRDIGRTIQSMLRREKYEDFGTIEGYFRSMTKGNRFECEIHDDQSGLTVHCYFKSDEVAEQAWSAFMKERVAAHGLVRYDKEGCPTSIVADAVRFFPAESELPSIEDIQAIYRSYKK
jgi:hypothetical protein